MIQVYNIYFCFLNKDGSVERDEYGCEIYHKEQILAVNEKQAKQLFYKDFKDNKPEIVDIIRR